MTELYAPFPDSEHRVRWSPADGDTPAYIPVHEAVRHLAGYYRDEALIREHLEAGVPLRTPFAFYQIDEAQRAAAK